MGERMTNGNKIRESSQSQRPASAYGTANRTIGTMKPFTHCTGAAVQIIHTMFGKISITAKTASASKARADDGALQFRVDIRFIDRCCTSGRRITMLL